MSLGAISSVPRQNPFVPMLGDTSDKQTVRRGDTLAGVAKEHGLSLQSLLDANPGVKPHALKVGSELNIPSTDTGAHEPLHAQSSTGRAQSDTTTRTQANQSVDGVRGGAAKPMPMGGVDRSALMRQLDDGATPRAANPGNTTTPPVNAQSAQSTATPSSSRKQALDMNRIPTSGASAKTARQDRVQPGVEGSKQMAQHDEKRISKYKDMFEKAGQKYNLPPSLLAAIASRESRGGAVLSKNGTGDHGNGYGLMQIDKRSHTWKGGPYSQENVNQGAQILASNRDRIAREHPGWNQDQVLKAAVSAYNKGFKGLSDPSRTDRGTTGGDYANDVIARAQYFQSRGY